MIHRLKQVETALDAVAKKSGAQADELVSIIQENGEIQANVKRSLEASVMQTLLMTVLNSDSDEDFVLSHKELLRLETRLSNLPGVAFDKANFQKFCANKELTLAQLMQLLRNLKDDTVPEDDNVFHLKPENLAK
jgi:vacuolar-type H+-ATPase subunit D/Vma8